MGSERIFYREINKLGLKKIAFFLIIQSVKLKIINKEKNISIILHSDLNSHNFSAPSLINRMRGKSLSLIID